MATRVLAALRLMLSRALDLFLGGARERRLGDEIQSHLDLLTDDFVRRGMAREEAGLAARRAFGGVAQVKEAYRDQRGLPFVDSLTQDVRFAFRLLRRNGGFGVTAVTVLGIGIGVNTMLFTILNAHTIRGLPVHRPDRVLYVSTVDDRGADRGVSYLDYLDLARGTHDAIELAAFVTAPVTISGGGHAAERIDTAYVSANAFGTIGVRPILGRDFAESDDRPGAAPVAMLNRATWLSRYDGDPSIVGRSFLVNGTPTLVIGILPDRSGFPSTAELWLPLTQSAGLAAQPRDARTLRVFGRIRDGVTIADARLGIDSAMDRLSREYPAPHRGLRAHAEPINERFLGRLRDPVWLAFMFAGILVVLISCANVANLMLAHSVRRTREIAIRTSLGAGRRRVVRQLLIEGLLLAVLGGCLGLGVAVGGVRLFRSAIPENVLPYWYDYSIDARVVLVLIAVSIGTLLVFALLPALHTSKTDINTVLKDSARTATETRAARRWATGFLAAEFALAVVLLSQLALSIRTSAPPLPSDRVIDTSDVLTASLTLPAARYRTPVDRTRFHERLSERLRAIGGVSAVSVASFLPLQGGAEVHVDLDGAPARTKSQPTAWSVAIGPRYFETLGIAISRGRDFSAEDGTPGQASAIVSDRFVRRFLADRDPIGQRITVGSPNAADPSKTTVTIVGVVPDIRQRPSPEPEALVYLPFRSTPQVSATLLLRSNLPATTLTPIVREAVSAIDADLPLYNVRTMHRAVRDARWNGRVSQMLIVTLTFIAVGLSIVGLYAVTAHTVGQRTQEIGVRMALGARPVDVIRIVVRRALGQLALGFTLGILCTILWDSILFSGRQGLVAADPIALAMVMGVLLTGAAIACFVPTRRAMRLDPVSAIRRD